jgi:hypothetical protein
MKLASGSEIRLSGDTALKMEKLYKDGKLDVEKTGLEMLTGQILVKVKPLLKDEEFAVRTRTALAGVRGTEFVVEDTPEETSIYVNSGAVQVSRNINVDVDGDQELSREVSRDVQQETAVTVQPNRRCTVNRQENRTIRDRVQGNLRGRSGELRQPGRRPGLLRPLIGGATPTVAPIAPGGRGVFERFRQNPTTRLPGMPGASRTPGQGLLGRPGFAGRPGMPGLPGRPGTTGVPGMTGRPGMPGVPGTPGTPGIPGVIPGRPERPGMTDRPGMPGMPGNPSRPAEPKKPANPLEKFKPRR